MKKLKIIISTFTILAAIGMSADAMAQAQTSIAPHIASKIAEAYALGIDHNIEEQLDGETLETALDTPSLERGFYRFVLLDSSGDCGLGITLSANTGKIDTLNTDDDWFCL